MHKQTPFDPDFYLGTVTSISPGIVKANFPRAVASPDNRRSIRGNVGDFVFIECDDYAVFGRITDIHLPDRERLQIEPGLGKSISAHPIGNIQLLAGMQVSDRTVSKGLPVYPRIGDRLFLAHPELVKKVAADKAGDAVLKLALGSVAVANGTELTISPEALLGRHCGIFGSTGGGKSWTLARVVEEIKKIKGKAILFDATGEFCGLPSVDRNVALGNNARAGETVIGFPYTNFNEADLFAFFTPSMQSQAPKLREAIKSLKLVKILGGQQIPDGLLVNDGCVVKINRPRQPFLDALQLHADTVNDGTCNFDVTRLAAQVTNECVFPNSLNVPANWGGEASNDLGHCSTLLLRIDQRVHAPELRPIFGVNPISLTGQIKEFLDNDEENILRVSMEGLSFQYHAREIIANAIGRYLLSEGRKGAFKTKPVVCLLDEAHQFLERSVGDEVNAIQLDAFGLIAKEGRKYGLTAVFATQRPGDIPQDIISQLGTLVVHRLTNDRDRSVIERACGDIDRSAAAFLPILGQGEALIFGSDIPIPLPLNIKAPSVPPDSLGPKYHEFWGEKANP